MLCKNDIFCAQFNPICHLFLGFNLNFIGFTELFLEKGGSSCHFQGNILAFFISKLLTLDWKKEKKKKAFSTAELLQRFWTSFQRKWRLCGSVAEAVKRPLWVDWFFCLFGPYNWLGRTQAHVHSHTNTFNVSLKMRNKGKSPFFIGMKRGRTGLLCFVTPSCLCSLVFLCPPSSLFASQLNLSPVNWTTEIVGNTGRWRIKVMLLHKKLSRGGATDMNEQHQIGRRHHGRELKHWH